MAQPANYAASPIRIFENDVVQLLLRNVSFVAGPVTVMGLLRGYDWSIQEETEAVWQ